MAPQISTQQNSDKTKHFKRLARAFVDAFDDMKDLQDEFNDGVFVINVGTNPVTEMTDLQDQALGAIDASSLQSNVNDAFSELSTIVGSIGNLNSLRILAGKRED